MTDHVESGMFVGQPAWHGKGVVVEDAPSVREAIALAGLDWRVEEVPIFCGDSFEPIPTHKAIRRDSDQSILGVVGAGFTPVQNVDAFAFFEPFVESGAVTLEAAGSLKGGRRVWVLAKLTDVAGEVGPGDEVRGYLLLYHGHDGSLRIWCLFTPIRVVCWNTATAAIEDGKNVAVRIRHTKGVHEALEAVQATIDTTRQTFDVTLEAYRTLRRKQLPVEGLEQYVRRVFEVPAAEERMPRCWDAIQRLAEEGAGSDLPGVRGSLWGAYNAITEWTAYERGRNEDNRLDSNWFGPSRAIRDRAFAVAMDWN
jgi:phage/plasmid-like protein (TIGR03299 family)